MRAMLVRPIIKIILFHPRIFTDANRLHIADTALISNALLNTNSGTITIGEYTFFSHNVSVITGTHNYHLFGKERRDTFPKEGYDIVIGNGVWVGSNVTILGPCVIGDNAVIAAGAVVTNNVPANCIVGGVPAKLIKKITDTKNESIGGLKNA